MSLFETRGASSIGANDETRAVSSIGAIDIRRRKWGISLSRLLSHARVDRSTWAEGRNGRRVTHASTLLRLCAALDDLCAKKIRPSAETSAVAALFRILIVILAREMAVDEKRALKGLQQNQYQNRHREGQQINDIRRMAMYLMTVELCIPNADLARALDLTRQNVQQARNDIEAMRDDPAVDALLTRVGALLRGAT